MIGSLGAGEGRDWTAEHFALDLGEAEVVGDKAGEPLFLSVTL